MDKKMNGINWNIWDGLVGFIVLVLRLPLLPFEGVSESAAWLKHRAALAQVQREQARTRYELKLKTRASVDFVDINLKRLREMEQRFLNSEFSSYEEAQLGYQLLEAARAKLIAQVLEEVGNV